MSSLGPARRVLLGAVLALSLVACAPAGPVPAGPSAAEAPVKPASSPAARSEPAGSSLPVAPAASAVAVASPAPSAQSASAVAAGNPAGPFRAVDSAEWQATLAAARTEGELTVYGTTMLPRSMEQHLAEFQQSFGVKVNWVGSSGDQTMQRVLAEKDTGKLLASAVTGGDSNLYPLYQAGALADLSGLPNAARIHPLDFEILEESKNHYLPLYNPVYGVYVNTQQVGPAEEPRTWRDLLDPKWKGKIVMHDPGRSGGGVIFFAVSTNAPGYGEAFHQQLARQEPLLVASPEQVDATVARGERAVGLPGQANGTVRQRGAPLKWLVMADGMVWNVHTIGAVEGGPAPNAARVLLNWLLSPEIQLVIANEGPEVPSTAGIANPLGLAIDDLKPLGPGRPKSSEKADWSAKARQIYGR
jgi:iron(III) transport system substrate-binding protein